MLGLPDKVHACLFDLDGVLTDTASVHNKAWKATFDAYLTQRAEHTGAKFVPFDPDADYRKYVDGKKREDGVRSFLDSRGIKLPDGSPDDSGDKETVYGLGNRKNEMFQKVLEKDGVEVFDGSRRYLEAASAAGLGIAVVSSSANTREVLHITGLERFIQQRVDGVTLREEHIAGKPAPDSYPVSYTHLDVYKRQSKAVALSRSCYSHSMVPGGLLVMSSTTRLTSDTSLVMRVEMRSSTS